MDDNIMANGITLHRRRFLGASALALAAADLVRITAANAQSGNLAFGPVKQIAAGELNIGYAEAGSSDGPVVILLHGWPYDIHAFVEVAPVLAASGYRVVVPHLRGF